MTFDEFRKILDERMSKTWKTLDNKAVEYSKKNDRLHNFKTAARIDNTTPEEALKGMLLKHLVSVFDMIESPDYVTQVMIDEKIGDCICYFILLEACFSERIKSNLWEKMTGNRIPEDKIYGTDPEAKHYAEN